MLTINEIYKKLPHRYPFLMVDRILEIKKDESVTGIKNVTVNEPFFQGHFPDEPLMPAAMIVESMAQIGGFIFELDDERGYVVGVDKAKFKAKVIPGDTLKIECKKITRVGGLAKVKAVASVDGSHPHIDVQFFLIYQEIAYDIYTCRRDTEDYQERYVKHPKESHQAEYHKKDYGIYPI